MSVKTDANGRRWISVEVEVPGTPEQVWEAIATGPGISSWFVPTEIRTREDGTRMITSSFGPGMESVAPATAWDPPRHFAKESAGMAPGSPPLATEWFVEALSGGTCKVRVVHSLIASGEEWDNQLTGVEKGWPGFFAILQRYLAHFAGQPAASFRLMGFAPAPLAQAWAALGVQLGLDGAGAGAGAGAALRPPAGTPVLAGRVERVTDAAGGAQPEALLALDQPAPGTAFVNALEMGGRVFLGVAVYLYGGGAAEAASREEPAWQQWMAQRFPAGAPMPGRE
jgi:uncharacterized protein YndB with AHSA1/START domain